MTDTALTALLRSAARSTIPTGNGARLARRFTQASASVTLECDDPDVVRAAVQMLGAYSPQAELIGVEPTRPGSRVTVHTAWALDTLATFAFAGAPVVRIEPNLTAHVLDSPDGQACTFWIPEHETVIHADLTAHIIDAYCARPAAKRYWAPRLVRELVALQLRATGAVYAHGSACTIDRTGLLILGPPGVGATTTLLTCLRHLGADLVSDAGVLLRREARGLAGHAWPGPLRIGVDALRAFPELRRLSGAPDRRPDRIGGSFLVETSETSQLLRGGTIAAVLQPRLMVWPELDLDRASAPLPRRVVAAEVHDTLHRTRLFTASHDGAPNSEVPDVGWLHDRLLPDTPRPITTAARAVVDALTAHIPCFRVAVSSDPSALATQLAALLPPSATTSAGRHW